MKRPFLSLGQYYWNLRIKHKILALIAFIMVFSFSVVYMVLQYAYSIYDEELYKRSSQVLNLSSNSIENELRKIERMSFNIATDPSIQSSLTEINATPDGYTLTKGRETIEERLVQYAGGEKYVYSVELFDLTDHVFTAGRAPGWTPELRADVWQAANNSMGEILWLHTRHQDTALLSARLIRSYTSNQNLDLNPLGVVVIRIRMDMIVADVSSGTDLDDGELVIASDEELIYPLDNLKVRVPQAGIIPEDKGYVIQNNGSSSVFISRALSGYTGWTYYNEIPYDTIFQKIIWMKKMLIVAFAFSLIVMLAISLKFSRSITKPIDGLITRMKQVQRGDFSTAALPDSQAALSKDEVGHLHRTFRVMIQQIDELITENYAKQLTIKETQFRALQAQINPHFLYNTLESINWEAKINGQTQISRMVEALGFLFRSSISLKKSIVTLGEELDIIRHYLTIQETRFEDRLIFQLKIPEHLYSTPIPKLTLQPLLENAINHAVERKLEPCHITLFAVEEEDSVHLIMEDDGPGMVPELLEQVRKGEVESRGNGIGLSNIRDRIRLAFGEPYGLDIDSVPDVGTKVLVHIPKERREGYV